MNRIVLGILKIGATLLLMSLGIMMIGARFVLFIISLPFPGLRKFVPDIGAFVDILRGILFDKIEQDEFRNGDVQDDILDEWSDTTDRPRAHGTYETVIPRLGERHMFTEPYPYAPHPENPKKPKPSHFFHHEPHTEHAPPPKEPENPKPYHYDPKEPEKPNPFNYSPHYIEQEKVEKHKEPHHNRPETPEPHPLIVTAQGPPHIAEHMAAFQPMSLRIPKFNDEFNKIVCFDLTDQAGDSD